MRQSIFLRFYVDGWSCKKLRFSLQMDDHSSTQLFLTFFPFSPCNFQRKVS